MFYAKYPQTSIHTFLLSKASVGFFFFKTKYEFKDIPLFLILLEPGYFFTIPEAEWVKRQYLILSMAGINKMHIRILKQ